MNRIILILVGILCQAAAPNIILILADDMDRDRVSCYGSDHQTPHIDRLASQGVRYETAWCMPSRTPTRVTLLTGQYPCHHGWTQHYDVPRRGGEGLSPERVTTFARMLRDAGYATAIGGKWQMNHLGKQPNALKEHGFDEHYVWPRVDGPDAVNAFLIDFIRRQRDGPFLVYYPMLLSPLYKDDGKTVSYMDQLVGKLVSAVDELELANHTLILFTADSGSKGKPTDLGAHVPFIVRTPFLNSGGRISRDLIDFTDVFPSLLELADAPQPKGLRLDGKSFVPSLRGSDDPFDKRSWIYAQLGDFRMIRDWQHILDNTGNFHNLLNDPRQERPVSPLDKIAPGRRQRLQMILDRFPPDAAPPFPFAAK